jgi:hypothetical protein
MNILRYGFLAFFTATFLCGCFLVPAYDSFRKTGVTESQRIDLLPQELKRFTEALYWGKPGEALAFVAAEHVDELREGFAVSRENIRVVESKVTDIRFNDGAQEADVQMTVRYYQIPFFVVKDRQEQQKWEFGLTDGWKLKAREISERG